MRALRQDKLIAVDGWAITIVDFKALSLLSDFEKSYLRQVGRREARNTEAAGQAGKTWSA
jgi:hypothetical protein